MDAEEKELFKKLLSKVEDLQKEVKELKKERTEAAKDVTIIPKFPPITTKDKLTRAIIKKAREKIIREAIEGGPVARKERKRRTASVQEIRDNFSFGEIARFALKKNLLKSASDKEEKAGSGDVVVYDE